MLAFDSEPRHVVDKPQVRFVAVGPPRNIAHSGTSSILRAGAASTGSVCWPGPGTTGASSWYSDGSGNFSMIEPHGVAFHAPDSRGRSSVKNSSESPHGVSQSM